MQPPSRLSLVNHILFSVAVTVALCYYGRLVILPTLLGVAAALLLAPVVGALERFRLPRWLSAFVLILLLLFSIYAVTHLFYGLFARFVRDLPTHLSRFESFFASVRSQIDRFARSTRFLTLDPDTQSAIEIHQPIDWAKLVLGGANSVGDFLFVASFVPFITYFLLTWLGPLHRATVRLFPQDQQDEVARTLAQIAAMMRSVLWGNLLVGLLVGAASSLLFGLLGLPYFYLLGLTSGLLSMVPYLGFVLALLPPLLLGLGQLSGAQVLVLFAGVLFLHLVAINLLVPKWIGQRVQVNPLAATLSLLLWGVLWGGIGLLLAVPIAAALKIVCDHIEATRPLGHWLGDEIDPSERA